MYERFFLPALFALLLLSACSSLYKKSTPYQEQVLTIDSLMHQQKELEDQIAKLEAGIKLKQSDTITIPAKESPEVALDTTDSKQTGRASKGFFDVLIDKEGFAAMTLSYRKATFDVFVIKDTNPVKLFWQDKSNYPIRSLMGLKRICERNDKHLIFATNAGMYTPKGAPKGLYVENGVEMVPLDTLTKGYGNFYMQPNGVFLIEKNGQARVVKTKDYYQYKKQTLYATQSGPMAVADGKINPTFNEPSTSMHIRSGVGVDSQGRVIMLISNQKVNLYTFGSIFKDVFQCQNALYLDGAISQMYLPTIDRRDLGGNFGPMIGVEFPRGNKKP